MAGNSIGSAIVILGGVHIKDFIINYFMQTTLIGQLLILRTCDPKCSCCSILFVQEPQNHLRVSCGSTGNSGGCMEEDNEQRA